MGARIIDPQRAHLVTLPEAMSHSAQRIWVAGLACLLIDVACGTSGGGSATSGSGAGVSGASGSGSTGTAGGATGTSAAGSGTTGSTAGTASGAASDSGTTGEGGVIPTSDDGGACAITADRIRITEIDVGATVLNNELGSNPPQPGLMPLAISPIPSGGSRVAWMSSGNMVHITQLDANDMVVAGSAFALPAVDFQDIYADNQGGVLLVSRNAMGGGTLNCGNINNLCGATASLPTTDPCYDLYMVRFDGSTETWATELTDSTAALPPYETSPTSTSTVYFVWWYAHNGRIAFDGTHYAGYFGTAISISQPCVDATSALATAINIHQGDRMKVVGTTGALQTGGFDLGCSHSGYERIVWDPAARSSCRSVRPITTIALRSHRTTQPSIPSILRIRAWATSCSVPRAAIGRP